MAKEIRMLTSVASGELDVTDDDYVGGETYSIVAEKSFESGKNVTAEKADEFVIKGYAEFTGGADFSREYSDAERAAFYGQIQAVTLGGPLPRP